MTDSEEDALEPITDIFGGGRIRRRGDRIKLVTQPLRKTAPYSVREAGTANTVALTMSAAREEVTEKGIVDWLTRKVHKALAGRKLEQVLIDGLNHIDYRYEKSTVHLALGIEVARRFFVDRVQYLQRRKGSVGRNSDPNPTSNAERAWLRGNRVVSVKSTKMELPPMERQVDLDGHCLLWPEDSCRLVVFLSKPKNLLEKLLLSGWESGETAFTIFLLGKHIEDEDEEVDDDVDDYEEEDEWMDKSRRGRRAIRWFMQNAKIVPLRVSPLAAFEGVRLAFLPKGMMLPWLFSSPPQAMSVKTTMAAKNERLEKAWLPREVYKALAGRQLTQVMIVGWASLAGAGAIPLAVGLAVAKRFGVDQVIHHKRKTTVHEKECLQQDGVVALDGRKIEFPPMAREPPEGACRLVVFLFNERSKLEKLMDSGWESRETARTIFLLGENIFDEDEDEDDDEEDDDWKSGGGAATKHFLKEATTMYVPDSALDELDCPKVKGGVRLSFLTRGNSSFPAPPLSETESEDDSDMDWSEGQEESEESESEEEDEEDEEEEESEIESGDENRSVTTADVLSLLHNATNNHSK